MPRNGRARARNPRRLGRVPAAPRDRRARCRVVLRRHGPRRVLGIVRTESRAYTVLHETVPLFSWLRAPSRFGLVVVLGLAVFAGFAASALLARSRRAAVTAAALVTLTTADLVVAPLFLVEAEPVASVPVPGQVAPRARRGVPLLLRTDGLPRHAYYMLNSTAHWRPLVNGYSDYVPPEWREMVIPVSSFPNPESFVILQRHRVRYVVFHLNLHSRSGRAELERRIDEFRAYLKPIRVEDPVWLFEITGWPPPG